MKKKRNYFLSLLMMTVLLAGCTDTNVASPSEEKTDTQKTTAVQPTETSQVKDIEKVEEKEKTEEKADKKEKPVPAAAGQEKEKKKAAKPKDDPFAGYKQVEVDGGDLSGHRQPKAVVDIGYGDREYWAFTNEHGQLVRVIADEIVLQDDRTEPVTSSGRYYSDEAKVPGVESDVLDEGHVIADSLGGVSNAYNITPQDSTLNRHGDQAYMEDTIRKAGGASHFEAVITYPDTKTQIPSRYKYTYTVRGNKVVDTFNNTDPDKVNASLGLTKPKASETKKVTKPSEPKKADKPSGSSQTGDISSVDTNGNGQVTIQEAKDAGYSMPIMSDHWLYPYMRDNDQDGMVGE